MTFCIITHVIHTNKEDQYFAYAPYVNEMNIWLKHTDEVIVVAPLHHFEINAIHASYKHSNINWISLKSFNVLRFSQLLLSVFVVLQNVYFIIKAIRKSDHIHLRCPGNIGLLGCIVQIFFPKKKKTAKYAGNWDPKSKQPISYKLQRWILSNTFLTRNMQVLVYGEWPNQTKNIKSFFTATYSNSEVKDFSFQKVELDVKKEIKFLFVGSLTKGKRPLYAIQLVLQLQQQGYLARLELYGDGAERKNLEDFIEKHELGSSVFIKGNQSKDVVKEKYKESHFLILPSQSEGWPKVVAEAMFWGCVPIVTKVSCVPYMLDFGNRGVLLEMNLKQDVDNILQIINHKEEYFFSSKRAAEWSRKYTVDYFESEVKKLI